MGKLVKPIYDHQIDFDDETGRVGEERLATACGSSGRLAAAFYIGECDDTCDCGDCENTEVGWHITLGPFMANVGPRTIGPYTTLPEAIAEADELYEELVPDRSALRTPRRPQPPRTVSIPRGGQPRRP
ncbi:hypothetical protein FCH28_30320 [Streptomyces piniterrae]|uniref:Uncharacterized protein n=1 Tax=Streptomyces piniterrae TaxID=2571125 RepID=A0A4U0N4T3_9ACTN|nr:hypothetical protein [Streptomyces piniterrae]TJZ44614.1 hypothetical protein FCH28_30320 [Streptomyces piniterrae]